MKQIIGFDSNSKFIFVKKIVLVLEKIKSKKLNMKKCKPVYICFLVPV